MEIHLEEESIKLRYGHKHFSKDRARPCTEGAWLHLELAWLRYLPWLRRGK